MLTQACCRNDLVNVSSRVENKLFSVMMLMTLGLNVFKCPKRGFSHCLSVFIKLHTACGLLGAEQVNKHSLKSSENISH